ncbi:KEOPS complex subunit [Candidatus Bathyarchaeota archaeon]|nr:MAG: KEOPS complex subunit [Candidatus Bathyarchaeota archaeon]
MKIEARIVLEYEDELKAEAVAKAVSPDNVEYPEKLSIKTFNENGRVVTLISCREKIGTLITTLDDLMRCISVAEKTANFVDKTR